MHFTKLVRRNLRQEKIRNEPITLSQKYLPIETHILHLLRLYLSKFLLK